MSKIFLPKAFKSEKAPLSKAFFSLGSWIQGQLDSGELNIDSQNELPNTVQGDILYASGTNTIAKLNKSASATRYLSNTGSSNNPAWAQINLANGVTGDLPFANLTQGSGLSVLGVAGNATADVASIAAASDNQVLRRSGTSLAFGAVNLASSSAVTGILPSTNLPTNLQTYNGLKKYVALLTQTGTSAPTATVLENTLGGTPTYSYDSQGIYILTLAGAFDVNKTTVKLMNNTDADSKFMAQRSSSDTVLLRTHNSLAAANDQLNNSLIEIIVYP